jgi:hypothetical protein
MKFGPAFLIMFLPLTVYCQRKLSFGGEVVGVYKKSENIRPFDAYRLFGPLVQLSYRKEGSKLQTNIQTGFSFVRSDSFSNVYSIPLSIGGDYQFTTETVYGLTAAAGTRLMFSDDADKARLLLNFRVGVYYDLFKGVPLKIGYERIGNSDGIFVQLVVYGFGLKK